MAKQEVASLDRGRAAYAAQRWSEAFAQLAAADREGSLGVDDLERLGTAAYATGDLDARADAFTRAYNDSLRAGDLKRAIGFAFWTAFGYGERGEVARAEGWMMRAYELVAKVEVTGVETGYLAMANGFRTLETGDLPGARDQFRSAVDVAVAFHDPSLGAMSRQALGRTLIYLGEVAQGVVLMDEAMVAVTAGEVSPLLVGNVYCSVIEACKEIFDLRRAHEWTAALSRWCESQPDLVPQRGSCLVFRAELMRLHGAWLDAMEEAQRAHSKFANAPIAAAALYQIGEGHRLRGEFDRADEAFRAASAANHIPQPGLALLRLAQGKTDAARASLSRALEESHVPRERARLLPAYVEVMIASNDTASARRAADELAALADHGATDYLRGIVAHAAAAVHLADGDARGAVPILRDAWARYRDVEAPYEAARVRELLGIAYQALGDAETSQMEFDASRTVFEQLEAEPDAARVRARMQARRAAPGGLTARELEVLALVAGGRTNRAIANELVISEKTVARHLSNIFDKLGVSSRAALTAYAYEHKLVGS